MQPRGQDGTLVMAAVRVVFPWSTWPIVPMFICGFLQFPSSSQNHFQLHNGSCAVESLALICTSPGMGARDWTKLQEKYRVPPQSPLPALLFKLISRHCERNKLIGTLHLILRNYIRLLRFNYSTFESRNSKWWSISNKNCATTPLCIIAPLSSRSAQIRSARTMWFSHNSTMT